MEQLGRYEILQELGRGAMGVVYKARDPNIDRLVAIKVISPEAGMDPDKAKELRDRFQREARAAGRLSHQNIVTIYDSSEVEGRAFLVMEFIEGKTLESLINAGMMFSLQDVASIGNQVAQALDYAHQNGIVHRDIKPANVMLTGTGLVKVADFGIARITETSVTRTGLAVGTPSYMSPEQVAGQKVDGRSDQFSLGVLIYELLSGEKAFPGDSLTTVLYRIMQAEPIPLRQVNPGLPEAVDVIIRKAMAKNPNERYPRAADFGRDLLAAASGQPISLAISAPAMVDATLADGIDVAQLASKTQTRMAAGTDATLAMEAAAPPVATARPVAAAPPAVAAPKKKSQAPLYAGIAAAAILLVVGIGWFGFIKPAQERQRIAEQQAAEQRLAEAKAAEQKAAEQKAAEQKAAEPAKATPSKPPQVQELILAKEVRGDRPGARVTQVAASDPQVVLYARGSDLTEQQDVKVKWFDPDNKEIPPSGVPTLKLDGKGGWRAWAELALAGSAKPGRWKAEFSLGKDVTQALSFTVTPPAEEKPVEVAKAPTTAPATPAPAPPAAGPRPGTIQKRGKDEVEMVLIPPGTFTMGDAHGDGDPAERPSGKVTLGGFWIDRFDVTFDLFAKFVQAGGYKPQGNWEQFKNRGGNHPVVGVTWNDALAYCRWADKRLPTEAEWEYAARGTDGRKYPWGEQWDPSRARFRGNRAGGTSAAVGSYPSGASAFGVMDMAGNVWQWTASLEKAYPYVATDGRENLQSGGSRVSRGGSWLGDSDILRTSVRDFLSPTSKNDKLGFRCAQNP